MGPRRQERTPGVGLRQVLASRGFRWLVSVRLVGSYGDGLVQAALATFVLFNPERAATPTKVAVAFTVLLLPYSLVGPFAGVLLDRWRRRQVLLYANGVRAVLVVLLAVVVARGGTGWTLALVVLFALGINRFVTAALSAGTPHVVPEPYLVTANAIGPTLGTVAAVLGGLTGVAVRELVGGAARGSVTVLLVAVLTYAAAGLLALTLGRDQLGPAITSRQRETFASVARGLVDGVRHLQGRPRAARAIALVTAQRATFGIALALAVLQVRGALHPPS
ncbi:MAG: MFS transporter, partial [Candidatus Nanopelagicales bacterium]